jgi:uncharacterized protein (TIGR00369 family)
MTDVTEMVAQLPVDLEGNPHGAGFTTALGLTLLEVGPSKAVARAHAGPQHHQEAGIVHGGWHAAIVETVGSIAAHTRAAEEGRSVVGVSNFTEFFRPHVAGPLDVEALPVHQGRTQQVWEVRLSRSDGKLVARGQLRLQHVDR